MSDKDVLYMAEKSPVQPAEESLKSLVLECPATARWFLGGSAHVEWRQVLEEAIQKGELKTFHSLTGLPVDGVEPAQQPNTDAEFDPSDRSEQLDIANMADRAVCNGYGDPSKRFKRRLLDWLDEFHPELSKEARDRIATIANRDKEPGRTKAKEK
jgi:hypothetical protein